MDLSEVMLLHLITTNYINKNEKYCEKCYFLFSIDRRKFEEIRTFFFFGLPF